MMNEDTTDRISHLPVPLLHDILFHLPVKEEARTCVLSKSWNQLVWSSLPRRSFDFNHRDYCYEKDHPLYTPNENERDQKFVNLVDDSLKTLQMGRFKIPTFSIRVDLPRFENSSFLDRWLESVARNHVENLFLDTLLFFYGFTAAATVRNSPYIIPEIALASSTPLQALELSDCNLQRNSLCDNDDVGNNVGALALEKLCLRRVTVDNQGDSFQNFIFRCPSLVHFLFVECLGVKKLLLLNNPKVRIVEISLPMGITGETLEEIVVDSLCLHTFMCIGSNDRLLKVEATRCRNLLQLHLSIIRIECNLIQNLAANFPHLEKLHLRSCTGLGSLSVLRHPCLKTMALYGNDLIELDVVDMPNLVKFVYEDKTIPTKMFISNASSNLSLLEKSHLSVYHHLEIERPLNTLWFLQLKTYLGQLKKCNLTVKLVLVTPTCEFNVDELSDSPTLDEYPSNVESLDLNFFEQQLVSYERFFDGLFWSCRPKKITIIIRLPFNRGCIEGICEILLTGREESPDCCNGRALKCWRHFFKDFALYVDDETVSSNEVDPPSTELLEAQLLLPQNVASYREVILNLSWM